MENFVHLFKKQKNIVVGIISVFGYLVYEMIIHAAIGRLNEFVAERWKEVYPMYQTYSPYIIQWALPALIVFLLAYFLSKKIDKIKDKTLEREILERLSELREQGVGIRVNLFIPWNEEALKNRIKEFIDWKKQVKSTMEVLWPVDASLFYSLGGEISGLPPQPALSQKQMSYLLFIE